MKVREVKVTGVGSSAKGSRHWRSQRVTALMLIPLTVWFMISIVHHTTSEFEEVVVWISHPGVVVLLVLYFAVVFSHAQLGLQVVIEDYIHGQDFRTVSLLLSKGILLLSALASIFSVLRVAL